MADVDITIRTIDKTNTKGMVGSFTELNSIISIARQGVEAFKKAYDFSKQGAQIQFTADKFDRLSESIGTTGKALLTDLKSATRGMYSDMELMASATDLVGLGLANTHDEAVRLAHVAGGLNMNMNQLVLTLTNMTTMRFDALGVSVDGFKQKVDALEASGMSAADAFKEAFLQQAEAQLARVGEAADSPIGAFMQLEASVKNLGDTMKETAATAILPFVRGLNDSISVQDRTQQLIDQGIESHQAYRMAVSGIQSPLEKVQAATESWDRALMNQTNTVITARQEQIDLSETYKSFISTVFDVQKMEDDYTSKKQELTTKQVELEGQIAAASGSKKQQLLEDYAEVNGAIAENEAAHNRAIASMILGMEQQILATNGWTEAEMNLFLTHAKGFGLIDESTQATANNYLRAAMAMSEGNEALANSFFQTVSPADTAMTSYSGVADSQRQIGGTAGWASEKVEGLEKKLSNLDGMVVTATVNINVNGSVPNIGKFGTASYNPVGMYSDSSWNQREHYAAGGTIGGGPGSLFTVGEQGWEMGMVGKDGKVHIFPHDQSKAMASLLGEVPGFMAGGSISSQELRTFRTSHVADLKKSRARSRTSTAASSSIASEETSAPQIPVATLTNTVTQEVTRMSGSVAQATIANVSATDRQTALQERSNAEMKEELRNINRNIARLIATNRDDLRTTLQEIL